MSPASHASATLDNEIRIHAFRTGTVAIHAAQARGKGRGLRRRVAALADREWTPWLPILAWAIEHPTDGLFFVDSGETARTSEAGYLPRLHPYFRVAVRLQVTPEQEIGPLARRHGLEPSEARGLLMTHLHTDHAGGLDHFEGVPTLVDAKELQAAAGTAGRLRGYLPHRWPESFSPRAIEFEDRAVAGFEHSYRANGDDSILVLPTPGHSPGHVSVLVRDGSRQVLIGGDIAYDEGALLEGVVDGVATNDRIAEETNRRLRELIAKRPTVVLPTHDPDSIRRLSTLQATGESSRVGADEHA